MVLQTQTTYKLIQKVCSLNVHFLGKSLGLVLSQKFNLIR